jgi:ArsR family transcriptional regulator
MRAGQKHVESSSAILQAPELEAFASAHLVAKAEAGNLTTRWLSRTEQRLRLAVEFFGAKRPLDAIDARDVHAWIRWLQRRSRRHAIAGLSAAAVRHYLNALSNLYRYAELEGVVEPGYNPAATVRQRLDVTPVAPLPPPIVDHRITAKNVVLDAGRALPLLKALADERRLQILILLSAGQRSVSELQSDLRVGQSLLSFHLRTLKDVGLVSDRRVGRSVYYALSANALEELETFIRDMRSLGRARSA